MIDSLDWLERLILGRAVPPARRQRRIEKVDGGYARGYTHALTYWREIIDAPQRAAQSTEAWSCC